MRRGTNRLRWRERRDTLPARRRQRRQRRRDIERKGPYDPIDVDPSSAARGVRSRLIGAILALVLTLVCLGVSIATSLSTFSSIFALTVGLSSFGAGISLLLSARDEEKIHELATELDDDERDRLPADTPSPPAGTDGFA